MTYPHDKFVRDWLDGHPMQYREGALWLDMPPPDQAEKVPHFYRQGEYRHKPQAVRSRLAVVQDHKKQRYLVAVNSLEEELHVAQSLHFVRWHTEWVDEVL